MKQSAPSMSCFRLTASAAIATTLSLSIAAASAHADAIIPGPTGEFEESYLQFILDHHYSGLRPTELAAGTDTVGPTQSDPYPGDPENYPPTMQKGTDPVVLEIASMSNAAQRREIHTGQGFLQSWYGYTATLDVIPSGQELIAELDAAEAGDPFNIAFLTGFSLHHVAAITRSLECVDRAGHNELREYCADIVSAQTEGIQTMVSQLQTEYGIDFDPLIPGDGASEVPEPATMGLLAGGLAAIGLLRRRVPTVRRSS